MNQQLSSPNDVYSIPYVDFMALINESNRAPGGKSTISKIIQNSYINNQSRVLHIGCNTGITTRQIASYVKCKVNAIDIANSMVNTAIKITTRQKLDNYITFQQGDASKLNFENEIFDLVITPGSLAFMKNKNQVMNESVRVLKTYGFFADTPMYYKATPPSDLITQLNDLLHINIEPWGLDYWKSLYEHPSLENSYEYLSDFQIPSEQTTSNYCKEMVKDLDFSNEIKKAIENRLFKIMSLFVENHRYLGYAVLIFQKVVEKEQISLFGK